MFNYAVKQLPLTDASADEFFSGIKADSFNSDGTFTATLRVLLYGRLREGESISVKLDVKKESDTNPIIGYLAGLPHVSEYSPGHGCIHIRVIKGLSADKCGNLLSPIDCNAIGFKKVDDIGMYLSKGRLRVHVYISEDLHQVLVIMNDITMKVWHLMQSAIPRLLPWYFDEPPNDVERNLLLSLTKGDSKDYIDIITAYASKINYREEKLRRLLGNYCSAYEQKRLSELIAERDRNLAKFEGLQAELTKCIEREQRYMAEVTGLEMTIKQGNAMGLADYFIRNNSLHLVSVDKSAGRLVYVVTTYLEYFDQQQFDKYYSNPNSYFYGKWLINQGHTDSYKALLRATFGDDICIRIRTCAAFRMDFPGNLEAFNETACLQEYTDWLEHPHIVVAKCMGGHTTHIKSLLLNRKYIEAIEQTVASTKNINFADSGISSNLCRSLAVSRQKFLELPTGEVVTPTEATAWLYKEGKI